MLLPNVWKIELYQNQHISLPKPVKLCFNMLISKVISKKILIQQAFVFFPLDLLCHGTFNSRNNYQYQYSPAHSSDN